MEPGTAMLIASGIGGVTGLLGAKSGAGGMKKMARALAAQTAFAREVYNKQERIAQPFRDTLYPMIQNYLRDPSSITSGPMYAANISPLMQQFNVARDELEERSPRGGALTSALANLYGEGARARSGVMADLYNRYEQAGLGLAQGNPQLGMQAAQIGAQGATSMMPSYQGVYSSGMQNVGAAGYGLGSSLYDYYMGKGGGNTNLNYGLNVPKPSPYSLYM